MHKFNLTIEIPDKDYCNGCGFLEIGNENGEKWNWCGYYKQMIKSQTDPLKVIKGRLGRNRPDICKQNDKEKTK